MNDEFGNPIEPGLEQQHMVPTGHMTPLPKVTKIVHGNAEKLTNPASTLKITSGLGTQAHNNGNEIVLATQTMPLDVWQAVPEVPKPDESDPIGRFDNPLVLADDYAVSPDDEWHLWTTAAGNKTASKLGVTVRLGDRTLTFDSTGTLVKVAPKFNVTADSRYLHPWQCYIESSVANSVAVKVNPVSTLMKTYGYRAIWKDSTWLDRQVVSHFTDTFTLTDHQHVVWLEVVFSSGEISTATVKSGMPWGSFAYVSADNSFSGSGNFTWYQLLAYFKPSADAGGSEVDAVFSGTNYKLMCPTTTHLMQGFLRQAESRTGNNPDDFYGIVPWFGCLWQGS